MQKPASFTGQSRRRRTNRFVLLMDGVSKYTITVGGIGTIVAVLGVFVFLLYVAAPLFTSAEISRSAVHPAAWSGDALHVATDEYQTMGWALLPSGKAHVFRLDTGHKLAEFDVADQPITAASFVMSKPDAVLGLADGSIVTARIGFETAYGSADTLPEPVRRELAAHPRGHAATLGDAVVQLTPDGQARTQRLTLQRQEPVKVADAPIEHIAHVVRGESQFICFVASPGGSPRLWGVTGEEKADFLTGRKALTFTPPVTLPLVERRGAGPKFLAINGSGADVYVAWQDGWLQRTYVPPGGGESYIAEQGGLVGAGATLTAMGFILGNNTLVWGDSNGNVSAGFTIAAGDVRPADALRQADRDKRTLQAFAVTKQLENSGAALTSIGPSGRARLVLCGFADGTVRLYYVTTAERLAVIEPAASAAIDRVTFTPKGDGLLVLAGGRALHAQLDPGYPEARPAAIFRQVWYEGYSRPMHLYQSSSGDDESEPKLGMMPLVFGTLKATFYSMIFGAPLALLAAVFSSEFLKPRARAMVKPGIVLMASLPSVVLGFLAALVFAPVIERFVPATVALGFTLPMTLLLGAYVWQMLPGNIAARLADYRLAFIGVSLAIAVLAAAALGPVAERLLFGGDFRAWTAFTPGSDATSPLRHAVGGWAMLLAPLAAIVAALLVSRTLTPWLRQRSYTADRSTLASLDMAKFALGVLLTAGIGLGAGAMLESAGFDPRGSLGFWGMNFSPLQTYVQRNALVVGFVMGFAIIPIIYTIADDALSAVPNHLRSASLGAGATVWQTAMRVVIPTAMSGLFSAVMVGLGRAVGETMIVLMATGNTPIMEWNIFNGFRTLSANIAVELPEAVKGSTHFRFLFLAALVLFAITFIVNTVAEVIRLRFRRRAYQL